MIQTREIVEESLLSVTIGEDRDGLDLIVITVEEDGEHVATFSMTAEMANAVSRLLRRRANEIIQRNCRNA